jgi:thiosulfate dehydrogenase (quinone) large subunit
MIQPPIRPSATRDQPPLPPIRTPGPRPSIPLRRLGLLMLPLRLFFGATFLYAGLDKLLDPTFLDPNAPGSIVAQMHGFALHSPLAPLINAVGLQFPLLVGLLIAVAEIGVGLGALTGIGFRIAAFGGFATAVLFWLTASWNTHPYYYGEDLPYAFGWLTLLLVGDCDVLTLAPWLERKWASITAPVEYPPRRRDPRGELRRVPAPVQSGSDSMSRRMMLQVGVLAAAAIVLGGVTRFLAPVAGSATPTEAPTGIPTPSLRPPSTAPGLTPGSTGTPIPTPSTGPVGQLIAKVADVQKRGSASFTVPRLGDPGLVVRLQDGSFAAFDAVCTHAGCTVSYVERFKALLCPCHGAAFDPNNHGAVLQGPTQEPLTELPITVDQTTGRIYLKA